MVWTPEEEAQRLAARFKAVASRRLFAFVNKVPGGDAMIYQHITGRRPISMEAALAYSKGFKVPLAEISPRLAEQAAEANKWLGTYGDDSVQFSRSFDGPSFSRKDDADDIGAHFPTMQPILSWQHEDELPDGEFVMVPRLEVNLSAGPGSDQVAFQFNEAQPQAFRAEWVRQQHLKPNKLAAMTADGRSMEPTIHDGDSLLVDTSQVEVKDGKVYALWYEGGERVKRLYRLPGGGLRIRSDNAVDHPEIVLGPEYAGHVRIIGRVVHRSGMGGL